MATTGVAWASPTNTVTISSGTTGPGTLDPNVQASANGSPWSPAYTVAPNGAYSTIAGTNWDSAVPDGTTSAAPVGDYYYRAAITPSNAVNPAISGQFYSDNQGWVSVNGSPLANNNPCGAAGEGDDFGLNGAPPTSFSGPLNSGSNTLSIKVNNCTSAPNPTGVDFTATVTYTLYPTDMNQCKNGGWQNYTDMSGTPFKNQGDCVSYVATRYRNPANG